MTNQDTHQTAVLCSEWLNEKLSVNIWYEYSQLFGRHKWAPSKHSTMTDAQLIVEAKSLGWQESEG